jgi:hypothetical protein
MYKFFLEIMEPDKDKVSFYSRMENFHKFLVDNDLYKEIYEPHRDEPLSIIWAATMPQEDIFEQQVNSFLQMPGIFQDHDEFIFVFDKGRREQADDVARELGSQISTKVITIDRGGLGDRPTLSWDIGLEYATHDRCLFIRDLALPFNPWELIAFARSVDIDRRLTNTTTVLGPTWARTQDQWMYLTHPRFAPNPFLFCFVASKSDMIKVNGFDRKFARGFDHTGELDFLLRWNMDGNIYDITEEVSLLHPGQPPANVSMDEMRFTSSITRRYFFDRFGDDFIAKLKPPYHLDAPLIEVNHALTYEPFMEVICEEQHFDPIKDAFTFAKRPTEHFVVEQITHDSTAD